MAELLMVAFRRWLQAQLRASSCVRRTQRSNQRNFPNLPRHLSTTGSKGERLRVAVVGGGCSGMSSALHLAPLVEQGLIEPIDLYCDNKLQQRDIGVGIWSTALHPFYSSDRPSHHQLVYQEMSRLGTWVGPTVGYRVPKGPWLLKSRMPTSYEDSLALNQPALLFLREKDMLLSLRKAVHWEENMGTITVHQQEGGKTRVSSLKEDSSQPWSANLILSGNETTERDYHLVVAADGTNSVLRKTYGGYDSATQVLKTGGTSLPSPMDLPAPPPSASTLSSSSWDDSNQQQAVGLQDRQYTVFRGNASLTDLNQEWDASVSFQTWGECRSMRFATVPMKYPGVRGSREERMVWFITIDDDSISSEPDPEKRRDMLLNTFSSWHSEVCQIVKATPPTEILMERAVAHRHCMGPVLNVNRVIERIRGKRPPSSGDGPCLVFVGDAYMTIDPILAQGFTVAMEGAYALRTSVEQCCTQFQQDPSFAFDPYLLRKGLQTRHDLRTDRLVSLLRVTELVQALGQPTGGAVGRFNTNLLRPFVRLLPNFIKRPIFDSVMKYSLGLSSGMADKAPLSGQSSTKKTVKDSSLQ